jgi:tRNA pseudouridine55 synthase
VGGRRLHELARAGIEVEREARPVTVERFDVAASPGGEAGVFRIEVDCSTGTYIRVLAADLGEALGGGAHLRNLRRTRIGSFGVEEAHTLDALTEAHVLSPAQALRDLPQVELDAEMARSVSHGLALDRVSVGASGDGPWALLDRRGELLAVYEATGTDRMVALCVLAGSG